jgi:hypothetical protein
MHKSGKIISKRKCIQETNYNRFIICGVNKDKQIFSDLIQEPVTNDKKNPNKIT